MSVVCIWLGRKRPYSRNLAFKRPFSDVKPLPELSVFNFQNVLINCLSFCLRINTQFSGTFCPEGNVQKQNAKCEAFDEGSSFVIWPRSCSKDGQRYPPLKNSIHWIMQLVSLILNLSGRQRHPAVEQLWPGLLGWSSEVLSGITLERNLSIYLFTIQFIQFYYYPCGSEGFRFHFLFVGRANLQMNRLQLVHLSKRVYQKFQMLSK